MFTYVQGFLIVWLEVLCCMVFYETFSKRRSTKRIITFVLSVLFSVVMCAGASWLQEYYIAKELFVIATVALFMMGLMDIRAINSFMLSVLFNGLLLAVDYITVLTIVFFFHGVEIVQDSNSLKVLLLVILGKMVLFLFVLIIKKGIGKQSVDSLGTVEWLRFLTFPVFSIGTVFAMLVTLGDIKNQRMAHVFFVIAFGLAGMNFVVFHLIHDILERENKIRENEALRIHTKNQMRMYRSISDNFEKQCKKTHEYKNQIMCMDALVDSENYSKLKEYIKTISGKLNKELDVIDTNNVIVNAVLNTKYREAVDKNIIVVLKINDLSSLKLSDEDTVIILSNLLNNAIEACEQCKGRRVLKLKFVVERVMTIISVKNTYEKCIPRENGQIKTSKHGDAGEHGYGIKNVIDTVKKNGGSYSIRENGQEFSFSVILYN